MMIFSVLVNGAYPTAAEVSLAPRNSPFLSKMSASAMDPGLIWLWYLTCFSGSTKRNFSLNQSLALLSAISSTGISSSPTLNVARSPKTKSMGSTTSPPPNLGIATPAAKRLLSTLWCRTTSNFFMYSLESSIEIWFITESHIVSGCPSPFLSHISRG